MQLGRVEHRVAVRPDTDRTARSENTLCLREERLRGQPVKGLSDSYEID